MRIPDHVADARLPISQNVIEGRTDSGSAANLISATSAEKSALTTMPERISMRIRLDPGTRDTEVTSATAAIPKRNESV